MVNKNILKIRKKLDKLDNNLIEIIRKRTRLIDIVIKNKKFKKDIVDKKRISVILKNISKKYGATIALNNCNISINESEIHVLIGSNGSGKSTLCKIISGSDLAMLASVDSIPKSKNNKSDSLKTEEKHILAKKLLEGKKIFEAWEILI